MLSTPRAAPLRLIVVLFVASVLHAESGGVFLEPYGVATAGQGAVQPRIWAEGHPSPGQSSFGFVLDNALGGAPALLVSGGAEAALPVLGLTLNVDPFAPGFFLPWTGLCAGSGAGAGNAKAMLPLPNDPRIVGLELFSQFLVLDGAAPGGLAATRGLRMRLNRGPLAVLCGHRSLHSYDYGNKVAVPDGTGSSPDDVQFNHAGTLLLATGRLGSSSTPALEIYDATVSPLKLLKSVTLGTGAANHVVVHPDDDRAYVSVSDTASSTGYVHIVDIDRASPTFGTSLGQVTGLPPIGTFLEGGSMAANGSVLCVADFSLSGTGKLHVIDVAKGSPTRDTWRKTILLLGLGAMVTDVAVDEAGLYAYVCVASLTAQTSTYAQILLPTGTITKSVQLGSNALFPTDIDIDPLGRFLIVSCPNSYNVVQLSLEPGPNFMTARAFQATTQEQPFSVALTPDAKFAITASMNHGFVAWDVATGLIAWRVPLNAGGDAIAVR